LERDIEFTLLLMIVPFCCSYLEEINELRERILGKLSNIGMTIESEGKMSKRGRSRDWNEGLAEDLQDRDFAREFLLAAAEEDIPIQEALGKVIRAYGLKEFAAELNIPSSNLSRALKPSSNITQQTLNRLLEPFGLRLSIAPVSGVRLAG
jgi:DNA-binding phage protein